MRQMNCSMMAALITTAVVLAFAGPLEVSGYSEVEAQRAEIENNSAAQECDPRKDLALHESSFPRKGGYLPALDEVDRWHALMKQRVKNDRLKAHSKLVGPYVHTPRSDSVRKLAQLLQNDGVVRMYAVQMIAQVPPCRPFRLNSTSELLEYLDYVITHVPPYATEAVAFPMNSLFLYMMWTPAGTILFRNDRWQRAITSTQMEWCRLLDSPESVFVVNRTDGWLSKVAAKEYRLEQYIIDWSDEHGGFVSYNDFFHRAIKPELRPIASPGDTTVVTSSNDGTWVKTSTEVGRETRFWAKGQPYSIENILGPLAPRYADLFVGGTVLQSYLSTTDYHRYHSPIAGLVRDIRVVEGLTFSVTTSEGAFDSTGLLGSLGYESHVNTRGLLVIDSCDERLGLVVMIPIGMDQVASVRFIVTEGQWISKGQEVGWFSYGGSSVVLLFQPNVVRQVNVKTAETVKARQQIAILRSGVAGGRNRESERPPVPAPHAREKTEL